MSYLYNPLDKFQSYSTHYILVACRTSERAKDFAAEKNNQQSLDAIDRVKTLGDTIPFNGTKDEAYLVLDTRRFTQYSVESLKYEVFVNGLVNKQSPANFAGELEMTIIDSVGISFINFLQWLLDEKMQTNTDGMIFMLKTLFVGHNANGVTETVHTVTIPLMMSKIELSMDSSRGAYVCSFWPTSNFNTQGNSRWLNIGTASTYFTGKGDNTLGAMVKSFESELNRKSSEYYETISNQMLQYRAPRPGSNKFGRKVRYQITLPPSWENFEFNGSSTGGAIETDFVQIIKQKESAALTDAQKKASSKPSSNAPTTDSHFSVDSGLSITEVLDLMFKQTHEVQLKGVLRDAQAESVSFHKFLVSVTSDEDSFCVHVDVVEFVVPNAIASSTSTAIGANESSLYEIKNGLRIPKNSFELDYLFTGKNKDVLSFDMKLQNLAFLLNASTRVGEGELYGVTETGQVNIVDANGNAAKDLIKARAYDPIMIPMNSDAERKNFSQYAARQSDQVKKDLIGDYQRYTRNLSAFYANSPNTVNVTIKGNPLIMQKFNIGEVFQHSDGNPQATAKNKTYRDDLNTRILNTNPTMKQTSTGEFTLLSGPSYVSSPVFVKMNVKGQNVDFRTNEPLPDKNFSADVIFDQYYVVQRVKTVIEGGVFTQEMLMYTHSVFGDVSNPEKQVQKI